MYAKQYIYDVLYDKIQLPDYLWKIIITPEVQRLREVRLCNINSLCMTGGANVNRFEHSIGTAYLASVFVKCNSKYINEETQRNIVRAALLHDIRSAPFGHSVQYVLDLYGYKHEIISNKTNSSNNMKLNRKPDEYIYQYSVTEPIYFGIPPMIMRLLSTKDIKVISQLVEGKGKYGCLINGSIDLDNIDNVYRLAYHIGLTRENKAPEILARSFVIRKNGILYEDENIEQLEDWYHTRSRLYHYLLLNPEEFSAKCMLQDAIEMAFDKSSFSFSWHDVDYGLLQKLCATSSDIDSIISRLMIGHLYGCVGIYSTSNTKMYDIYKNPHNRLILEREIQEKLRKSEKSFLKSAMVGIHLIRDVNKTQREIKITTTKKEDLIIGTPLNRILIGVFFKNVHLSFSDLEDSIIDRSNLRQVIGSELEKLLHVDDIKEVELYAEAND